MDRFRNNERGQDRDFKNWNSFSNTRNGSSNTRSCSPNTRKKSSNTRNGSTGNRRLFVNQGGSDIIEENSTRRHRSASRVVGRSDNNFAACQQRPRRAHYIGFKYLESLLQQPLEETLSKLNSNQGFYDMLENELEPDFIVVIVKLLGKLCDCELSVRNQVLKKSLNRNFLRSIQLYISGLAFQLDAQKKRNSYFWRDPDSFWNNLAKACETVLKVMPQYYSEALSVILKCTLLHIPEIESLHKIHISDGIKNGFQQLVDLLETLLPEYENEKLKVNAGNVHEGEPPDNFRDISIYPTTDELIKSRKTFLRRNVVKGPYRDVEHYLDVQYRLLREDFVRPLKEGIQSYLIKSQARIQNVKIHNAVQFLQPITFNEQICALLKFNLKNQNASFKYENSRKFMFGSLVCFTHDDFKSLIFGRIADRSEKYLKNCELVIGFDDGHKIIYKKNYIMVECSVYFEPYYHVLSVLKSLDEKDFPMINYIIHVDKTSVVPNYITNNSIFEISQGSSTIIWQPFYAIEKQFFDFNPSQNKAFVAALTRKFSIIQGPPGTGKTFVGLKIAETLLRNFKAWYNRTPMLVICYTNHALDQFLEGLIRITDKIVRIGGQSKNENLKKFNLRNQSNARSHNLNETGQSVKRLLSKIKVISDKLIMIKNYDCVLDIEDLKEVIPQFENSWLASAKKEDVFEWLLEPNDQYQYDDRTMTAKVASKFEELQIGETVEAENGDSVYTEDEYMDNPLEDLLSSTMLKESAKPLFSLHEVQNKVQINTTLLNEMEKKLENGNYNDIFYYHNLEVETDKLDAIYKYSKGKLDSARQGLIKQPANINVILSKDIPKDERWNLYFYWVDLYYTSLLTKYDTLNIDFREAYKIYRELTDLEHIKILKNNLVIGMTTTAAARMHASLKMISSPIVIVEEAAEVLEAHIVTSLTKHCQQLILIGDHQQLKPSTSSYQIEQFYHLGISLFERMILNDVQCFTLNVQHRMRPEISSLIKPAIYPNLKDHESVFYRPKINGIDECLYFIHHEYPEERNSDDSTTKKNIHEVKFLIQLARYLILNGYKSGEITILAAYLGQMYEFQKERSKYSHLMKDIKITVLDNYQGEECDIILLSLVRNNSENRIGFLSIDNRVCVALSRARNGLYIMGNIKQLSEKSELWAKIKETLLQRKALGPSLHLKCQIHGKITMMSTADDFSSVVEGGCDQICGMVLACQHNCQRLCHTSDREHKDNKCQEFCHRVNCDVDISHICPKKCYEDCGPCTYFVNKTLRCNHEANIPCYLDIDDHNCLTPVYVTLPCGHETDKPCYIDSNKYNCPFPCDARLDCGHSCVRKCHALDDPDHLKYKCIKPCEKPGIGCENPEVEGHRCSKLCWSECSQCSIIVRKVRTKCSHQFDVECYRNVDAIECLKPCKRILPCGHKCKQWCDKPCGTCTKKVKKVIPGCNHTVTLPCNINPDKTQCSGKCPRILSCGHICRSRCNKECDALKCKEKIPVSIRAKCGHIIEQLPCSTLSLYLTKGSDAVELESFCSFPCVEILNCGPENKHSCSGSCGACFQGRIHKRCDEKCGQILICNHVCEIPCRETCKPCGKPCPFRCQHSVCKKNCGEPCSMCREPCSRKCRHQQCNKHCGAICNIRPCEVPCEKKLKKCGHPCVGFCGDPCPPLCRTCDKEVLEEIFFGTEDDEDARFVLLVDCGHVVESTGMESWLNADKNEIKFKTCPKCKTTIFTTQRYSDFIKIALIDILKVKVKLYGQKEEIVERRRTLEQKLNYMYSNLSNRSFIANFRDILLKYLNELRARLSTINNKGRLQTINIVELNCMEIKCQLLEQIYNIFVKEMTGLVIDAKGIADINSQTKFILSNLVGIGDDITTTQIENIEGETRRLNRVIQLHLILGNKRTSSYYSGVEVTKQIEKVSTIMFSLSKYENTTDMEIKDHLTKLSQLVNPSINITEAEKRDIIKAINLKQGHWYKCQNGHPYAIGECGGAMELSKCIECGVEIGGTNHRLLSTNAVATEMDGATYGAWSDAANLQNYDLQE